MARTLNLGPASRTVVSPSSEMRQMRPSAAVGDINAALLMTEETKCQEFPGCHGLERNSATLHAVLTTVPSRAEVWVDPLP